MAELADALDSGSSESNFMEVQVLLPAYTKSNRFIRLLFADAGKRFTTSMELLLWEAEDAVLRRQIFYPHILPEDCMKMQGIAL